MPEVSRVVDGAAMRAWIEASHASLVEARARLDALNVFPVADSDTGTNLLLTLAAGRTAVADLDPDAPLGEVANALADGALMGARGNSGIILSQYLRALGETFADQSEADGGFVAWALDRASLSATEAMAEPVEGTALTVVQGAADAGRRAAYLVRGGDVLPVAPVVRAAVDGARVALARTPSLLAPLAERGVVDAGGAGFVLLLQALHDVVTGSTAPAPLVLEADPALLAAAAVGAGARGTPAPGQAGCGPHAPYTQAELDHWQAGDYEVMYVLSASEEEADFLRHRLSRIGASVGVVGGVGTGRRRGLWHVHVHTDDPVAAVAAATRAAPAAHLRQVCVRYLRLPWTSGHGSPPPGTTAAALAEASLGVVACTCAPGLLAPLAGAGAVVVLVDPGAPEGVGAGIMRAVVDSGRAEVVVLPCEQVSAAQAHAVASRSGRDGGPGVEVLASGDEASVVGAVAAVTAGPAAAQRRALVAALARTRVRAVAPEGAEGGDLADAAVAAVRDLVRHGDEVLTVVGGRDASPQVLSAVEAAALEAVPGLEVVALAGGQVRPALALGVE